MEHVRGIELISQITRPFIVHQMQHVGGDAPECGNTWTFTDPNPLDGEEAVWEWECNRPPGHDGPHAHVRAVITMQESVNGGNGLVRYPVTDAIWSDNTEEIPE